MNTFAAATTFVQRALGIRSVPSEADWRRMLAFSDRFQLTLFLDREAAPTFIADAIDARTEKNRERVARLAATHDEIASVLARAAIDFTVLKGFTHGELGADRRRRVQYDIDLLCSPADAAGTVDALASVGYRPHGRRSLSDQHLPPLVRPSKWTWKGDYYDPEIPIPVELHTSLCSQGRDRLQVDEIARFPLRRTRVEVDGLSLPALSRPHRLAYACVHALRHILRDDARPAHVLELGLILKALAAQPDFWSQWSIVHGEKLRSAQAVAFRFAQEWFGTGPAAAPEREIACLPRRVTAWFEGFAWSPVRNLVDSRPNKDVVWLHYAMLGTMRDRSAMLVRRLLPAHAAVAGTPTERTRHHVSAIAPALASGFRWWRRATASCTAAHTPF